MLQSPSGSSLARRAPVVEPTGVKMDVFVRVRPPVDYELSVRENDMIVKAVPTEAHLLFRNTMGTRIYEEKHEFDGVFPPETEQHQVYQLAVRPLVQDVCEGLNCAVFAYGQTGTGKTYSMEGPDLDDEETYGIIPRAVFEIWNRMSKAGGEFKLFASMVEIYNEQLDDMLVPTTPEGRLRIVEDPARGGTFCQNLHEVELEGPDQILDLLSFANERARRQETTLNKLSSRSHRVLMLFNEFVGSDGLKKLGRLTIVDLAGSESAGTAGSEAARRLETKNINQSLLTFGRVIQALTDRNPGRIPYRDSKLTRLTSEALGGYCKTVILATVSPMYSSEEETQKTMEYAHLARLVYNKPQVNALKLLRRQLEAMRMKHEQALDKVATVRLMRDILLESHQITERSLHRQAKETRSTLHRSIRDMTRLYDDIGARRAVAASNHNAVHDAKKSVGSQAAGLQQAVAKFKRKQAVEFEVVTETVSRFAQDKQKEVNALTAELDSIEGKVLAGYETLQTGVTKHGESLTEFVEARIGANEELQEQFRGMVGDEKAEVLQRLEAVRSALSETNAQLTTWQAEVDSKLEANAQHAESYLQRIQQDIDSVVTYTKQHGKAFRGRLTQYGTSLDDFLASEAAAAEQSKQQLLQQVQRLIDEHNQTAKHRMESSIRELKGVVRELESEHEEIQTGCLERVETCLNQSNSFLAEQRTWTSDARRENTTHRDAAANTVAEARRGTEATESQMARSLETLQDAISKHIGDSNQALREERGKGQAFVTTSSSTIKRNQEDLQALQAAVKQTMQHAMERFSAGSQRLSAHVVGQSKQMQSHCDSVTAAVVALQKAVDTFASTTYKPDTVDEPPRSTYSYPKKFAKTPAYTDTLRDFEADWNEEIAVQSSADAVSAYPDQPDLSFAGPQDSQIMPPISGAALLDEGSADENKASGGSETDGSVF